MRPSIDSERIASPAYSMTWPVPPAVPISPMMARMMSLAVTPGGSDAVDRHAHVLRLLLDQRLRREHVLDLGRADPVRERAEGAVRRGVGIAADDRRAGKREALLGSDDVHDALADVALAVIFDAELVRVLRKRRHLERRFRIVDAERAVGRRHVVVDDGERLLRLAHLAARRRASPRRPGATSPRGQGAGRYREGTCRRAARRPRDRPRSCRRVCGASPSRSFLSPNCLWAISLVACRDKEKARKAASRTASCASLRADSARLVRRSPPPCGEELEVGVQAPR